MKISQTAGFDGVISLLKEHGDDARVIAGGHSLIPLMKLRMAEIPHLIDLQSIEELTELNRFEDLHWSNDHAVRYNKRSSLASLAPILKEASLQIADPQVYVIWGQLVGM